MVEVALNLTAEQVIEQQVHGILLQREGNRGTRRAAERLPVCGGRCVDRRGRRDRCPVAGVGARTRFAGMGRRPGLATSAGRRRAHDALDDPTFGMVRLPPGRPMPSLLCWPQACRPPKWCCRRQSSRTSNSWTGTSSSGSTTPPQDGSPMPGCPSAAPLSEGGARARRRRWDSTMTRFSGSSSAWDAQELDELRTPVR